MNRTVAPPRPEDVIVGNSADSYLTDARGRKYIDFMMGWCVGNLGWGNTEIRAAARGFDGPDYVHPDYLYRPWARLAEMLARITPGKLAVSYRTTGGTESVEGARRLRLRGRRRLSRNGLLVSAEEDVIMIFPALNISRATAQRRLDIFETSL